MSTYPYERERFYNYNTRQVETREKVWTDGVGYSWRELESRPITAYEIAVHDRSIAEDRLISAQHGLSESQKALQRRLRRMERAALAARTLLRTPPDELDASLVAAIRAQLATIARLTDGVLESAHDYCSELAQALQDHQEADDRVQAAEQAEQPEGGAE